MSSSKPSSIFRVDPYSQALFDAAEEAVFVVDDKGVVLAGNDMAAYEFGLASKDALLGRAVYALLPPDMLVEFRKGLGSVFSHDEPLRFEGDLLGRTYRMVMTPVREQEEKRVLVYSRDVTDERRMGEHLRREQQRQIFYMESLPGIVATVDHNLNIRYANRAFRQQFGKPSKDGAPWSLNDFAFKEEADSLRRIQDILETGQPDTWECAAPDGQVFHLFGNPMTDMDGSLVVMLLGLDITHRRTAEQTLLQVQEHQRAILDNVPALIWLKDKDARFREVNSAYAKACGLSSQELEGLNEVDVWGKEGGAPFLQRDHSVLESGEKIVEDVEFTDVDGVTHWVESTRVPLFDQNGEVMGLAGIGHDITSRKEAQDELQFTNEGLEERVRMRTQELEDSNSALRRESKEHQRTAEKLERAKKRAESLSQAKSNFLANVSHEIRTPLNAILGAAELAEISESTEDSQRYMEIIRLSGKALSNLVNDILDFSKMEAYRLRIEHVPFDIYNLLYSIRESMSVVAQENTIGVRLEIHEQLPRWVKGDPVRLRQILDNLVSNAIKFTREGEVLIKASPAPGAEEINGGQRLLFSVSDTGIGIPLEKQSIIFNDFEQADTSISREYGGTGLGLAISRKLVEALGGNIAVVSEEGRGSTFSFTVQVGKLDADEMQIFFPEAGGAKGTEDARQSEEAIRGAVLVVDDNAMNQELMRMALGAKGFVVHSVFSGEEALDFLSRKSVDLVLMDIQMPEMDGLTAVKHLRNKSLEVPNDIPVIAMTAHALPGDRERMIKAGCDDYLAKPVDMKELFGLIERYLSGRLTVAGLKSSGEDSPVEQASEGLAEVVSASRKSEDPRNPGDVSQALSLLGNRPDLLHRLEGVYVRQGPKDIEAMREALAAGSRDDLKRLVHLFKSTAATVGDTATSEIARSMESLVKSAGDRELSSLIDMLADSANRMVAWAGRSKDNHTTESS